MIDNGRKTIGVFISQLSTEFQNTLCLGISTRAKELDYNVIFFTNFGGYGQDKYDEGEVKITEIPCYEKLDGVILASDSFAVKGLKEKIVEYLKKYTKCPVVSVRGEMQDYYNVLIDDYTAMEDIIRHFIEYHGFTKLNFLAGIKGHPDSEKRLASYKRILEEYNIPVEEERIQYGNFWKNKPPLAVDYWLNSSLPWPEAIICANDYMATSVCDTLIKRGINVPEQIAVSGYDDLTDASEYSPTITTIQVPIHEMGVEAVNKIYNINEMKEEPKNTYLKTVSSFRESCGCRDEKSSKTVQWSRYYLNQLNRLERSVNQNAYMSGDLTGLTLMDQINSRLRYYVYEHTGFTDFYLCLFPGWSDFHEEGQTLEKYDGDELLMEVGIKNRVDYSRIRFNRQSLFPKEFEDDEPLIYYVAMLHHQEQAFGYVAIRFDQIMTYNLTFQAWMINVGNALENVRIHSRINRLIYKLEDMYIRDDLTELYNRRGLEQLGQKYLEQAREKHAKLMVFTADLDKLKFINDNYGHNSGDIAICAVADALQFAADDDEICIRCGGDEFTVIGFDYNDQKMERFVNRFIDNLDEFNKSGVCDFSVNVSYGWSIMIPVENTTIEDNMIIADSQMYKFKYQKSKNS